MRSQCRRKRLETDLERTIRVWAPGFQRMEALLGKHEVTNVYSYLDENWISDFLTKIFLNMGNK
jgi:hypothetical protein